MISVVIPTLNEAARLPRLLGRLAAEPTAHEVMVVDRGSADATAPAHQIAAPGLLRSNRSPWATVVAARYPAGQPASSYPTAASASLVTSSGDSSST